MQIASTIATELNVSSKQVDAVIHLLNEGATVPFIARYRKEATGGLDDTALRTLHERFVYLTELNERKESILKQIEEQQKLTPELKKAIDAADTKSRLEDLYLPYKPKRRTKAQIAREAGLEPLADTLYQNPDQDPDKVAKAYLNPEHKITTTKAALDGAKQILIERFSENADLLEQLRHYMRKHASIISTVQKDKTDLGQKFKDYFDFSELVSKAPSHRILALLRGQKEGILSVNIDFTEDALISKEADIYELIRKTYQIYKKNRPADTWLTSCVEWTWKVKLKIKITLDILSELRTHAESEAINVFKNNLKNLLMMPPAGKKITMGLDPAYRTGVKTVVIDDTGKLLEHAVIYPHAPQNQWQKSLETLFQLCKKYRVDLISIGNGTASRETDKLAAELIKLFPENAPTKVVISEAGASVYSASALAAAEFPTLDVSYRGAVSIARRLQDPLAELVKIDPKAIGVGQYQHDVNQIKLSKSLSDVLEDCVNTVGADINTASAPLLKSIAGLNDSIAKNIVAYREQHGRFNNRKELLNVSKMGEKTFEQAAGFLRIIGGKNPLDASAVHPESYPIVDKMLKQSNTDIHTLMGNEAKLKTINCQSLVSDQIGLPTLKDIIDELKKPGRDPRPDFTCAKLTEGIETLEDLHKDMTLEGTVTNVTHFGAFVDIGVHQDGLVHISELADKFVSNPQDIVKVGDVVSVTILEVDTKRKRIQLTMKKQRGKQIERPSKRQSNHNKKPAKAPANSAFSDALSNALKQP